MFDILVSAVKLVTSKDARDSASALIDLIKRSPEWQKDICVLEAKISPPFKEQAVLLSDVTGNKMSELNYNHDVISSFKTVFTELVTNAFEYGCNSDKDHITIQIDVSQSYIALTVINSHQIEFDPYKMIYRNRARLEDNPYLKRGRGLILSEEYADAFKPLSDRNGIKVIFYRHFPEFEVTSLDEAELTVITITRGTDSSSFKRRLFIAARQHLHNNLILDFSSSNTPDIHTSLEHEVILTLHELYSMAERRIVALLSRGSHVILPDAIIAYSWDEALKKISLYDLFPHLRTELLKRLKDRGVDNTENLNK